MIRSELDVLLDKVQDPALREDLRTQIDRLKQKRSFGLVFEQHIPERVRLPQHPIRVGSQVVHRDDDESPTFEVLGIEDGVAKLVETRDAEGAYAQRNEHGAGGEEHAALDSLVVITEFGEPVLPGFRHLGSIERGGDKPYHVVINGENHHALEALRFTHAGKVDCIYIDPPYNSGARDWKYNNNYVDDNDAYRHSKWLAFMERRLKLAREILDPADSVLIVTIDEKEYLRLGLLLEQVFAGHRIQMISSLINPAGGKRSGSFGRNDEYLFFVMFGAAAPQRVSLTREWLEGRRGRTFTGNLRWDLLRRSGHNNAARADRPALFYPIYVDPTVPRIAVVGRPIPQDVHEAPSLDGLVTVLPIRKNGTEGNWQAQPTTLERRMAEGRVRVTGNMVRGFTISVLQDGEYAKVLSGAYEISDYRSDGSLVVADTDSEFVALIPSTQWRIPSHDATQYGTRMLNELLGGRRFPFPKSLYAVEDALRFFVNDKPNAVIVDFFAGSGTTAHAVARLNKQDGGFRQSILVTNNEVSAEEAATLRARGNRPGDVEWESLGVFEHITRARVTAAITGLNPEGRPLKGDYRFADEFSMADGFEENVAFVELRYLDADDVDLGTAFDDLAPLLWLRAGAVGPIARRTNEDGEPLPYVWTDQYGILFDEDRWRSFVSERPESARTAFLVTYSPTAFSGITAELPSDMEVVRLPDSYLSMFLPDRGRA